MNRRHFLMTGAALLASPMARASTAELPKGQIKITVGWAPGGGTDVFARIIGQQLGELWGRAVVVENKPGATGVLAAEQFARSRYADDVSLLIAHVNTHAISPHIFKRISYDPLKDFKPIVLIGATPHLLVTSVDNTQYRTLDDVVAACKGKPDAVSFGSSGAGSVQHMALEMFNMAAGVRGLHVPYKGSGPMHTDLIGRQIDFSFDTMTAATAQVKGGKLKALAQTRRNRAKGFPEVPTMDELGFKGFDASSWYGVVGPQDMPDALAQRLNTDINRVLSMPDISARFDGYGVEDGGGTTTAFADFMAAEYKKWGEVVRAANISSES